MFKKKRLAMLVAVGLAVWAGSQYGWWLTPASLVLLVALLAGLKWIRYVLAHSGIDKLRAVCEPRHMARQIEALHAKPAPDTYKFVVLGDNRNAIRVPRIIYDLAKQEAPAFIFNTGDLVRFGRASEYMQRYVPLLDIADPVPVFSVPGNHDRGARHDFAGFNAVHGAEQFSFDYGSCRFVGVNNAKKNRLETDDIEFLRRELGRSSAEHRFVFIHIPPRFFEDGTVTVKKRRGFKKLQREFHELMVEQRVNEVFMGHIHGYATKMVDGVRYTLTAGAGAPLSRQLVQQGGTYNYVVIHVTPNGLRREVVRNVGDNWTRSSESDSA